MFPRAVSIFLYVTGVPVVAAAAMLRQSGVPASSTVWAEDGRFFYSQGLRLGFWRALFTLHDGYDQLFPRLAVEATRLFPVVDAAAVMAWTGALALGGVSCLVFHVARGQIGSPALRVLLVASMVLLPVANVELLDNLVNVPWWLFYATFWLLLWRPASSGGRACATLVCFVAAASEPLVAIFLPLSLARAIALRDRQWRAWVLDQAPTVGLCGGLLYQIGVIATSGPSSTLGQAKLSGLGGSYAVRAGFAMLGGERLTDWLAAHANALTVLLGGAMVVATLVAGLLGRSPRRRVFVASAVIFSIVCYVVPVWARGVGPAMGAGHVQVASRYEAVPLLLLLAALLVVADSLVASVPAPGPRLAAPAVALALLLPGWVIDFHDVNQRSGGPSWSAQVTRGAAMCAADRRKANAAGQSVALAIDPAGWTAVVPCRTLGTLGPAPRGPGAKVAAGLTRKEAGLIRRRRGSSEGGGAHPKETA
ncbi:MAG TPA: hypothetical protein VME46_01560 [Acidimicrobiales bacterium]|nr:hypothetical protein [Acidimicrobiales bacterium]